MSILSQLDTFATGLNSGFSSAWEAEFSILYFQHLQNRLEKMYVHALHAVHALPDLRVAAGRLRDGVSVSVTLKSTCRRIAVNDISSVTENSKTGPQFNDEFQARFVFLADG